MITDQPFWASRVAALGAGPRAVPYKSLSAGSLGAAIRDAVTRDSYRGRARELAGKLPAEDGTRPVTDALEQLTRRR
jgi:sterol 3beta-glucosyltransferase